MKPNKNKSLGGLEIYTIGRPNFDELTKAEKRLLLLPLVEVIQNYYKDPTNRANYEKRKVERNQDKNLA